MALKSIELFAGAGGLGIGLHRAGFDTQAAVEYNKDACKTLRNTNLLGKNCIIHEMDVKLHDYNAYKGIDLVSGGPPCQPFSLGGNHSAQNDDRDMFPEAVRAVRELQPKAFIFENVKGLLRKSFATYFEYILLQLQHPDLAKKQQESWRNHLSRLEKHHTKTRLCSYNVVFRLLNSADYGVPQKRERVVIVGIRSDLDIEWSFPEATHSEEKLQWDQLVTGEYWKKHKIRQPAFSDTQIRKRKSLLQKYGMFSPEALPWHTVRDALSDLPKPYKSEGKCKYSNHAFKDGARIYPGHTGSYIDLPSKTLKAGVHGVPGGENMIRFEDESVRYFTVRESARIQTFPDTYFITGAWSEAMRQLGNAVPVRLAECIGKSVYNALS